MLKLVLVAVVAAACIQSVVADHDVCQITSILGLVQGNILDKVMKVLLNLINTCINKTVYIVTRVLRLVDIGYTTTCITGLVNKIILLKQQQLDYVLRLTNNLPNIIVGQVSTLLSRILSLYTLITPLLNAVTGLLGGLLGGGGVSLDLVHPVLGVVCGVSGIISDSAGIVISLVVQVVGIALTAYTTLIDGIVNIVRTVPTCLILA